ncbi:hypothetical protein [Flavilitoribacter nigricans]|uniref:Uncharacterized protein n=1 Tax=Flavilitoribacter nigricans (strain ATCC 23147 / DSM 23189 / NBRC 102662 / NCIMB 1420 / SS-2) TaxID=1122177 RepID=A0A2D0MYC9_FLAN2|nr:hypothetical protein [Flavilitoribacter nigricans]PHN01292.1 hypothetical protein CRP01_38080 [Flavilitoribacter nigricans DSM 23189 = NBRC 102662]
MYWTKELYSVNLTEEEFESRLEKLIVLQEKNSLKTHVFTSKSGSDETVRGELTKNGFTIWRTNRTWNGMLYPIFKGGRLKVNGINLLEIKVQFNPFAEVLVVIFGILLAYGITTEIVIQENNEFKPLFLRILVGVFLFFIFQSVPLISFYNLKRLTMKGMKEYLNLTKVELKKRKLR